MNKYNNIKTDTENTDKLVVTRGEKCERRAKIDEGN